MHRIQPLKSRGPLTVTRATVITRTFPEREPGTPRSSHARADVEFRDLPQEGGGSPLPRVAWTHAAIHRFLSRIRSVQCARRSADRVDRVRHADSGTSARLQ